MIVWEAARFLLVTLLVIAVVVFAQARTVARPQAPAVEFIVYARVVSVGTLSESSVPTMRVMDYTVRDDCDD